MDIGWWRSVSFFLRSVASLTALVVPLIDFARGALADCHSMDKSSFAVNIASDQDAVRVIDHGDFEEIYQIRI